MCIRDSNRVVCELVHPSFFRIRLILLFLVSVPVNICLTDAIENRIGVCFAKIVLTTARAKIETFVEWGWDYFGKAQADPVLDRMSQANINWNADEEKPEQPGLKKEE